MSALKPLLAVAILLQPACSTLDYWYSVHFRVPKNPFEEREELTSNQ